MTSGGMNDLPPSEAAVMSRLRWAAVVVCGLFAALAIGIILAFEPDPGCDFEVYRSAASKLPSDPDSIYDWAQHSRYGQNYIYPPLLAALVVPLTAVPRWTAYGLWVFIELSAAALLFVLRGRPRSEKLLALAILPLPLTYDLFYGQVNMVVLALVALAAAQFQARRDGWGGALLAAAGMIKLLPLALMVPVLATGRWKSLRGFGLTLVACVLFPAIWLLPSHGAKAPLKAVELNYTYFSDVVLGHALNPDPAAIGTTQPFNNSLPAVAGRLGSKAGRFLGKGEPSAAQLRAFRLAGSALGASALALVVGMAFWNRRKPEFADLLGVGFLVLVLSNVTTWHHHLVVLAFLPWRGRWAPCLVLLTGPLVFLPLQAWMYAAHVPELLLPITYFVDWGISTAFLFGVALWAMRQAQAPSNPEPLDAQASAPHTEATNPPGTRAVQG